MQIFISLFFASLLVVFVSHLVKLTANKWSFNGKLPPGPTPLPVVGNMFEIGDLPHRSFARLAKIYGPVMRLKLGQVTTIVISSPDAAREVLRKQDHSLSARLIPDAVKVLGYHKASMIWMPPLQRWKQLRTVLRTSLFTPQSLDANHGPRQQKMQELIEYIRRRAGQKVDIRRAAICTSVNLISNTLFSVDLVNPNTAAGQEFMDTVVGIMEEIASPNLADFFPLLAVIDPQRCRQRVETHATKMYKIFDEFIDGRLAVMAREEKHAISYPDFLGKLLKLHLQENTTLDKPAIKSMLMDTFIAGSDTSSTVVEWAMAELLRNPSVMAKAQEELKTVVGSGIQMEESDISRLPLLQAVVKETMRIHPPTAFLLPHKAEKSVEVGGYIVPKDCGIMVSQWAIGHDEDAWEDPELFRPERFLNGEVDFRGQHFELIPFGSGRRMCPGLPLAYRMVHVMLGSLIHSFEWKLPDGMKSSDIDLTEKFGATLTMAVRLLAIPTSVNY